MRASKRDEGPDDRAAGEGPTRLARRVGGPLLLLFIIGDMLGGGIYALVGEVGNEVGGAIWTAFAAAFALAALTALSYAELVSKYPRAAGAALYVNRAYGRPFLTFMVAFAVMASGVTSAAALASAFAGDALAEFVSVPAIPVALCFMLVVAAINLRGISESMSVNAVFTLIEIAGLVLIVVIGAVALGEGSADVSRNFEFDPESAAFFAVLSGAGLAFYTLIGFEDSVNVAEEVRRPSITYPRVLIGGLLIAGLLYLLVTFSASAVVPTESLGDSTAPLLEVVRQGPLGVPSKLFAAITLFALANGALINMIMASRLVYGMAEQGIVPRGLGGVLGGRRTPWAAIAFTTLLSMVLVSTGDLGTLADTTVTLLLGVFAIVNVTLLVLRRDPVGHDHFRTPTPAPVLGAAASIVLIADNEPEIFVRAGLLLLVGVGAWVANQALRRRSENPAPGSADGG